jgi:hypothetical protein
MWMQTPVRQHQEIRFESAVFNLALLPNQLVKTVFLHGPIPLAVHIYSGIAHSGLPSSNMRKRMALPSFSGPKTMCKSREWKRNTIGPEIDEDHFAFQSISRERRRI